MAKVEITQEEANQAYVDGYNEGRGSDFFEDMAKVVRDGLEEMVEDVVDEISDVLFFGLFSGENEKEQKLQEIYDAGYQKGQEDKEEYGKRD